MSDFTSLTKIDLECDDQARALVLGGQAAILDYMKSLVDCIKKDHPELTGLSWKVIDHMIEKLKAKEPEFKIMSKEEHEKES